MSSESHRQATRKLLLERRTSLRFPCRLQAICKMGGGKTGVDWPAGVRNISRKGAGLILARTFSPGTQFTVRFLRRDGSGHVGLMRVVHGHFEAAGHYHGCAFIRQLRQEEVDALVK